MLLNLRRSHGAAHRFACTIALVGCCIVLSGCRQPPPEREAASTRETDAPTGETNAAVKRLLAAPPITTADGFRAELLVPPGLMYDPLTVLPRGEGAWVNDDGREEGERGGRIYQVEKDGRVTVLVDTGRLYPTTGIDVAPAGFGAYAGQIYALSQPRATYAAVRRNHLILRVNHASKDPAEIVCTLPTHGEMGDGIPGGGLDARFGPPNTAFAGKLFAVTIINATIYQVTPDGVCTPFVTLPGRRPFGIAFTADGSRMLVGATAAGATGLPVAGEQPMGSIVAVSPDGVLDAQPIAEGIARPWGLAVAPSGFGAYAGEIFFTALEPVPPLGTPVGNAALYRLPARGRPVRVASGFFRPSGVAFIGNAIWVTDINGDFIPGQQLPDGMIFRITRQDQ